MKFGIKLVLSLVVALALVAGGVFLAAGPLRAMLPASATETLSVDGSHREIVDIVREEQIVLLGLGIQGVEERKRESAKFFGVVIPGSERAMFLRYKLNAKLGIDGKNVTIEQVGENAYLVTIPEFIVIGSSDITFDTAIENNGVMSWTTEKIDQSELSNAAVDEGAVAEYIAANRAVLQDQAAAHYRNIAAALDPAIALEFEFLE